MTNDNSIIKLANILLEIELNDNQGHWGTSNYEAGYSVKINDRLMMYRPVNNVADHVSDRVSIEYFDLIENSSMDILVQGISYSYQAWKNPWEFHYRIELHHYSYE